MDRLQILKQDTCWAILCWVDEMTLWDCEYFASEADAIHNVQNRQDKTRWAWAELVEYRGDREKVKNIFVGKKKAFRKQVR